MFVGFGRVAKRQKGLKDESLDPEPQNGLGFGDSRLGEKRKVAVICKGTPVLGKRLDGVSYWVHLGPLCRWWGIACRASKAAFADAGAAQSKNALVRAVRVVQEVRVTCDDYRTLDIPASLASVIVSKPSASRFSVVSARLAPTGS